jgi:hypothetical protein
MGLLVCALRPSKLTLGRPPCSSQLSSGDVVPMVPDHVTYLRVQAWFSNAREGGHDGMATYM